MDLSNGTLTLDLTQLVAVSALIALGGFVAVRLVNGPFLDGLKLPTSRSLRWLVVALIFVGPFLALIFAAVSYEMVVAVLTKDDEAVRNLGLLLTGVIGAGLVGWRNWTASRQADLQDEALFNDKINAAAEDLAARRQVTRGEGAAPFNAYEDDVVTRCAAIDRLEGLARERAQVDPSIVPRIAGLLSVYVRELSKTDLKPKEHGLSEEEATPEALRDWALSLRPIRSDLEKAAQVLGRLRGIDGQEGLVIDLREANLQGFDLTELDFDMAQMEDVQMEGANLSEAQMQGTDLRFAKMQGAVLIGTLMQGAILRWAQMQGADLSFAKIDKSTSATETTFHGAGVVRADWSSADLSIPQAAAMFGDTSVTLPFENPKWWPDIQLGFEAWRIEFDHWRANPDTYDWSQRCQHYTADGRINPDNRPSEYKP